MSNDNALAAIADSQQQFLDSKANIFLFDLKNEAAEHGFKTDESWHLQIATDEEIARLKRFHYPVVSMKLKPNALLKVYQQVKNRMKQAVDKSENELSETDLIRDGKHHIAAYPLRTFRK
jgi:hypothetical protein